MAASQAMRDVGLDDINLVGRSYNSGRKALEEAGFQLDSITATGRRVFTNLETDARVAYDSGKAPVGNQPAHWHIWDSAGRALSRLGRIVDPTVQAAHIPAG